MLLNFGNVYIIPITLVNDSLQPILCLSAQVIEISKLLVLLINNPVIFLDSYLARTKFERRLVVCGVGIVYVTRRLLIEVIELIQVPLTFVHLVSLLQEVRQVIQLSNVIGFRSLNPECIVVICCVSQSLPSWNLIIMGIIGVYVVATAYADANLILDDGWVGIRKLRGCSRIEWVELTTYVIKLIFYWCEAILTILLIRMITPLIITFHNIECTNKMGKL